MREYTGEPMRPVEWLQAEPLAAAGMLGLLLGVVLGLLWPIEVPPAHRQRAEAWTAPAGLNTARPLEREFTTVRGAQIWGDDAAVAGTKRSMWRLTGIIADPLPAALVLSDGSTDVKRVRAGGALPDGGVVKQITASGVSYVREGCTYERLLYGLGESAETKACASGAQVVK